MRKRGALPDTMMRSFIAARRIINGNPENVGPASYDLTLDNEIYRFPGVAKPLDGDSVQKLVQKFHGKTHLAGQPLEVGVAYVAHIKERLHLPEDVYAFANPKSTAGRLFLDVRLLADGVKAFDTVKPAGYSGDLWVLIVPRAFPIILREGDKLLQLRFFNADTRLDGLELSVLMDEHKLIRSRGGHCFNPKELGIYENDGACSLTLDLTSKPVGWECIRPNRIMRYDAAGAYQVEDFFRPVQLQDDCLRMQRGSRFILSTNEMVRVPPFLACEMRPFDQRLANFRAHGAGFIDPGWGWGKDGDSNGRPLTLEVEAYEDDIIIQKGEAIAKIRFERLTEEPEEHYDIKASTYRAQQTAQLARQFIQR